MQRIVIGHVGCWVTKRYCRHCNKIRDAALLPYADDIEKMCTLFLCLVCNAIQWGNVQ